MVKIMVGSSVLKCFKTKESHIDVKCSVFLPRGFRCGLGGLSSVHDQVNQVVSLGIRKRLQRVCVVIVSPPRRTPKEVYKRHSTQSVMKIYVI